MTGQPEAAPPLAHHVIREVEQHGYRVYPLADHVAGKIAATYEEHGETRRPSTRYRDLVDLVAIVNGASVSAEAQSLALRSEFDRRA
jgi:Nucleotidyl transferase AbiEii toxin, Type IV TA system